VKLVERTKMKHLLMIIDGNDNLVVLSICSEEFGAVLHSVTAADVIGSYVGESERRLRELFEAAQADADSGCAVVVFLDEVRIMMRSVSS
jgi:AAA+ superfamily predicted ATPase